MNYRHTIWIAILVLAAIGSGCANGLSSYRYWYGYSMTAPEYSSEKRFKDEIIDIRFFIGEKRINYKLKNLSDKQLTIDWDKATYTHIDGREHKVANLDSVFTINKDKPSKSRIGPGETVRDFIAPSKNVEKVEEWTWYIFPLFNMFDSDTLKNKGKEFGLKIPVKSGEEWKEYSFRFRIEHISPIVRRN